MNFFDGVMLLSVLSLVLGVSIFWSGSSMTAANIYGFAFALFVGFAGIYTLTNYRPGVYVPYLLDAAGWAYFGQVFIYCAWWGTSAEAPISFAARSADHQREGHSAGRCRGSVAFGPSRWPWHCALGQIFRSSHLHRRSPDVHCHVLAARRGIGFWRGGVAAVTLVVVATLVFNGFGRLQLGAFGLAIALAASAQFRGRAVKLAILIVSSPVMVYLAQERVAFTAGLNPNQSASVTGFSRSLALFPSLAVSSACTSTASSLHYFDTLFASAVFWVPRGLWPGKPVGFGATLGDIFHPELQGTGFSDAALFQSEWVYSFGIVGLFLMIPVIGLGVRWIHRPSRSYPESECRNDL